ncbi:MAG: PDZ domain-containing protein [Verrucomicrobiota bacterium]
MNSATSLPHVMVLIMTFGAGAGVTYLMTKPPEVRVEKPKAEKPPQDRVAKVEKAGSLSSSGKPADPRSPGVAARDLLNSSVPIRHRFEREGWDLAGVGIEAAMDRMSQLMGYGDAQERSAFISGMFEQFALSQKPAEALAVLKRMKEGLDRETAMAALLRGWRHSPEVLTVNGEFGIAGTLGLYMLKSRSRDVTPQELAAFARDFMKGSSRGTLLAEIAATLAKTDPAAAFALGNELTGQQQMAFMHRFADGWAAEDPDAAMRWAATVPDLVTRAELQASIIEAEARKDVVGAARHAHQLPANTPGRIEALRSVAQEWAAKDTRAALQWAETLTDEVERNAAQTGIRASAPVGIGALLGTQDGLPVISGLMDGGAAQRSGTLQKGDRILAVSDGGGQWVDAKDANLADVVGLIRGEVGSAVSLRVQPGGGGAPRVITITRQQIMRSPDAKVTQ